MIVDFNFKIDKRILAYEILNDSINCMDLFEMVNNLELYDLKTNEFEIQYYELLHFIELMDNPGDFMKLIQHKYFTILDTIIESDYFKTVYYETQNNLMRIEQNWYKKKELVNTILKVNMKIRTRKNKKTDVYMVHPFQGVAETIDGEYIIYGDPNGLIDPNFDLSILVHEYLHTFFKYDDRRYTEHYNIIHALIEIITNFAVYISLSDSGDSYIECYENLEPYRNKIMPLFFEYIEESQMNIYRFVDTLIAMDTNNNFLENKSHLIFNNDSKQKVKLLQ